MTKDLHHHTIHYLLLASGAVFFLALLQVARGNNQAQYSIIIMFVGFYILWGIFHHLHDRSFRLKVVLEYILIGALVLFLLQTLLLR